MTQRRTVGKYVRALWLLHRVMDEAFVQNVVKQHEGKVNPHLELNTHRGAVCAAKRSPKCRSVEADVSWSRVSVGLDHLGLYSTRLLTQNINQLMHEEA